jgi:hypothetical protein
VCISGFFIKAKAIKIMRTQKFGLAFKASDGWLVNFLRRKNFKLRSIRTAGRDLASDSISVRRESMDHCTNRLTNLNRKQIINMDEIALFCRSLV